MVDGLKTAKQWNIFLGMVRAREIDAQSLTQYLLDFLQDKGLDIKRNAWSWIRWCKYYVRG